MATTDAYEQTHCALDDILAGDKECAAHHIGAA